MNKIVRIEKLDERGYGVASLDGQRFRVAGALPGELVEVEMIRRKKGVRYCKVIDLIEESEFRVVPIDTESYLSTSPYQILDYTKEAEVKKQLIRELFKQNADTELPEFNVVQSELQYGYRNKFEFAFYIDEIEQISLAFHRRDSKRGKVTVDSVALAPETVNRFIKSFTQAVNSANSSGEINFRSLKSLIVRYSFMEDKLVYALYLKDRGCRIDLSDINGLESVKGGVQIYSDPKSPASVLTEQVESYGETDLQEVVGQKRFVYGYSSFFQINPDCFASVIDDIKSEIQFRDGGRLYDLYAGVGVIGLSLSELFSEVVLMEIDSESTNYASLSAELNSISNFRSITGPVEKNLEVLTDGVDCIVVDPPRSGLHTGLIEKILEVKPATLIYLSCNPVTQSEDYRKLNDIYDITFNRAYNFYPKTPHVEYLLILKRTW